MEFFLSQIAVVLPILGFDFLRPTRPIATVGAVHTADAGLRLILKPEKEPLPLATAIYKDTNFVVLNPQFNFGVDLTKVPVVFSSEGR